MDKKKFNYIWGIFRKNEKYKQMKIFLVGDDDCITYDRPSKFGIIKTDMIEMSSIISGKSCYTFIPYESIQYIILIEG